MYMYINHHKGNWNNLQSHELQTNEVYNNTIAKFKTINIQNTQHNHSNWTNSAFQADIFLIRTIYWLFLLLNEICCVLSSAIFD